MVMAACLLWTFAGAARGAVIAPVVIVNSPTITRDAAFSNNAYNPSSTSASSIDADGFNRQLDTATASFHGTSSAQVPGAGGGTETVNNSYAFGADQRQRVLQSENAFHFDATTAITATLNSAVTAFTDSNFFFISDHKNSTTVNINRTIDFTVDQPMQLSIQFSGGTSSADFKEIFSSLQLRGGAFQPVDMIYFLTGTGYKATDTIVFSGGGSKTGLDYAIHGTADGSGINLTFDLSPTIAGTTPGVEFSWLLKNTLVAEALGVNTFSKNITTTETINESVAFAAIPEPSSLVLAALSSALMCMRRRANLPRSSQSPCPDTWSRQ